jgi:DNA-binding TFAR19-related protein (PDSD5 family)
MIQISQEELAGKPFSEALRKRMLHAALAYYQGLIAQQSDDPTKQAELAVTQEYVQQILADLAVLAGGGDVDLLHRDDVRADLRLTVDQARQVTSLLESLSQQRKENFPTFVHMTPTEREQHSIAEARFKQDSLDKILTPEQKQRLGQVALQLKGLAAFQDNDVAAALNLTAAQKERLRIIESEMFNPGPPEGDGPGKPRRLSRQSAVEKFLEALTPDQKQQWKQKTGEPFQAKPGSRNRPGGGPAPDDPGRRRKPPEAPPPDRG